MTGKFEGQMENGAAARIRFCPQTTAMRLDNGLGDRQAHTHSMRLRGDKGLKQLRQNIG